ncbi:MAG: DUF2336 domain-containing protein [Alphaproteobacteria bacterium]
MSNSHSGAAKVETGAATAAVAKPGPITDINYLLGLARDKSTASRKELMVTISDLFAGEHSILSDRERDLMTDILRHLIHEVEMSVRRDLAERLSGQTNAPRDLIRTLANDEIEVAHAILVKSHVLHNPDLIEVIHHRTMEHQLAIAMRDNVPEDVADALVGTGHRDVIATLLENPSARISRTTMEYLVEQSKRIDRYQNPLVGRPDLGPDLAKKMYWWVSAALRQHILDNFDVDPTEIDESIESTVSHALEQVQNYDPTKTKPFELAERLAESKSISAALLIQVLRQGEVNLFEALFVKMTDIRLALARRLLFEPGGEGLAVACRAVGMSRADFATLFILSRKARDGDKPVDETEIARVLGFFGQVDATTAAAVVQRWRRNPSYLDSIRRIEIDLGPPDKNGD